MAWLIDTNVLSELRKGSHDSKKVRDWAASTLRERHYISVLSLGEIRWGIELLRKKAPDKCPEFERWLAQIQCPHLTFGLEPLNTARILPALLTIF